MSEETAANTDRELWREGDGDGNGMSYYEPSIHVTERGLIGINVGGHVFVKSLRDWHALAVTPTLKPGESGGTMRTWIRGLRLLLAMRVGDLSSAKQREH